MEYGGGGDHTSRNEETSRRFASGRLQVDYITNSKSCELNSELLIFQQKVCLVSPQPSFSQQQVLILNKKKKSLSYSVQSIS